MEIPRTALFPDLAGYQGALQADGAGGSLGYFAAGADHDHLQHYFRRAGETAIGWHPLSDFHLYRAAALAAVCFRTDSSLPTAWWATKT